MHEPRSRANSRAPVHLLHRAGGDVEVVALDLAARGLRFLHRFHAEQEPVAPVHERLRVDVLVVLGEVEAAEQRLVDDAAVVLAREAELRLDRGAEQRAAVLVEALALDDDARRRTLERLHVRDREAHVLEARRLERLEAENVADDRRGQVRDRAFLEQVEFVGDPREVLAFDARYRLHFVGLGAIVLAGRETVGPDHGPGGGRGFAGHRGGGLLRIDAFLRRDAEDGDDVGVLGHVARDPVAHLLVLEDPRLVAGGSVAGGALVLAGAGELDRL